MLTQEQELRAAPFYVAALETMLQSGVPFMLGGAYAMRQYADIFRDTKDLDVFCKPGDYPRLLQALRDAGYEAEVTDASWLAKVFQDDYFVDIIFGSSNGMCPVDDSWMDYAPRSDFLGMNVRLIPPEEMIWSKAMVQDRARYDGADVYHIIRKMGRDLDWRRLLMRMESIWELLLAHLINFRFVYPSERDLVPHWLMDELLSRSRQQLDLPTPQDRLCRGGVLSRHEYQIDSREWGYREI